MRPIGFLAWLALLPACRTVYVSPPAQPLSLDAAVAHIGSGHAHLTLSDGRTRPVTGLALSESTLSYQIGAAPYRYTRPRADVVRLAVTTGSGRQAVLGWSLYGVGQGVAWGSIGVSRPPTLGAAIGRIVLGTAASAAVNYALNPNTRRVLYDASVSARR